MKCRKFKIHPDLEPPHSQARFPNAITLQRSLETPSTHTRTILYCFRKCQIYMNLKHGTMQNGIWLIWLSPFPSSSLLLLLKQKGPKLILAAPLVNQRNYFVLLFFP